MKNAVNSLAGSYEIDFTRIDDKEPEIPQATGFEKWMKKRVKKLSISKLKLISHPYGYNNLSYEFYDGGILLGRLDVTTNHIKSKRHEIVFRTVLVRYCGILPGVKALNVGNLELIAGQWPHEEKISDKLLDSDEFRHRNNTSECPLYRYDKISVPLASHEVFPKEEQEAKQKHLKTPFFFQRGR